MHTRGIPVTTINSLRNYLRHGISPGDGIKAVLSGELYNAARRLDGDNWAALRELIQFVQCHMPIASYGDRRAIAEWIDSAQLRRDCAFQISEAMRELDELEEATTGSPKKSAVQ